MIAAVAFSLGLAATGAVAVNAATNQTSGQNSMSSLVTAISQKFNLNSADAQTVVDQVMQQDRAQREAQMQVKFSERLKQAVTDGKITQAQADLITAKQTEMKTFMDGLKDKTETERQTAMKTQMDSLKTWATQNNIPMEYLMFGRGGHGPEGKGFGGPRPNQDDSTQSQTAN